MAEPRNGYEFLKQLAEEKKAKHYSFRDYFDYLDGIPSALNQYKGVYMRQYLWAQATLSRLNP